VSEKPSPAEEVNEPNPKVFPPEKLSNAEVITDQVSDEPNPAIISEPNPKVTKVNINKSNNNNKTELNPSQPNPEVNNVEAVSEKPSPAEEVNEPNPKVFPPEKLSNAEVIPDPVSDEPNPAIISEPNPKVTKVNKNKSNNNNKTELNPSQPNPEVNNLEAVSEKPSPEVVNEPNPKVFPPKKLSNAEVVPDPMSDEPSPAIISEPNPKVTKVNKTKSNNNNKKELNPSQPNPEVNNVDNVSEKPSPEEVNEPNPNVLPAKKLSVKKKIKNKNKCCKKYDHNDLSNLDEESNSGYCKPTYRFYEVKCQGEGCKLKFVCDNNKLANTFKPTIRFPMYCCTNTSAKCTYALCFFCYTEKQNPSSV
jgi:hypothetical protein